MSRGHRDPRSPYSISMHNFERELLLGAIKSTGSISNAANALGVTRQYLYLRMNELGIKRKGREEVVDALTPSLESCPTCKTWHVPPVGNGCTAKAAAAS